MDCPVGIIQLNNEGDGFPLVASEMEAFCLKCGHCVAICPHGVLDNSKVPQDACPKIDKELTLGTDQAIQFLRSRGSIRHYKNRPVEKSTIESLIKVARYAPTAGNSQLVQWTVDCLRNIVATQPKETYPAYFPMILAGWDMGFDAILRGAPSLIVASAPQENPSGLVDVSLALSYLELLAVPMGLGTC